MENNGLRSIEVAQSCPNSASWWCYQAASATEAEAMVRGWPPESGVDRDKLENSLVTSSANFKEKKKKTEGKKKKRKKVKIQL